MAPRPLSDLDRRILEFEAQSWKLRGAKEQAIRDEFQWRWVDYYYRLSKLIENNEAAEAHSPVLIHRLRRLRDAVIKKKRRSN